MQDTESGRDWLAVNGAVMSSVSLPEKLSDGGVNLSVTALGTPAVSVIVAGLLADPLGRTQ